MASTNQTDNIIDNEEAKDYVPEVILRKRNREAKVAEERANAIKGKKQKAKEGKKYELIRAEKFVKEHRQRQRSYADLKKRTKKSTRVEVPNTSAKVILIIRIRGHNKLVAPQVLKILRLFRLNSLYSASLIRLNKATLGMLTKIEPYVTYGYPSRKTISDLIYKRGYAKIGKERIPITSNEIVEKHLGDAGIICVEDLVHELATCGDNFKEANSFVWSFKLNEPKEGFKDKRIPFKDGGDWGNREELINDLVQKMI